jgi:quercetin dioxygenase-like cupin family protein
MYKNTLIAVVLGTSALVSTVTIAEDAVIADPQHYTVEFENDKVRIIRIKYGPHEKSVMHSHGPNASVIISGGTVRMTTPDGASEDVALEPGSVMWADTEEHLPENLSDGPMEVVLVELKE